MKQSHGTNRAVLFGLIILIALRLIFEWNPLGNVIRTATRPLADFVGSVARDHVEEASQTDIESAMLTDALRQNEELRAQLNLSRDGSAITAEVQRLDMASYRKFIWINKGSAEGLLVNDTVTADGYLFGRVVSTDKHSAQVQVITDPEFSVTAQRNDEHGVVKSVYGSVLFDLVPRGDISKGEMIFTDGGDGIFKPNIPVAVVDANITEPGKVLYRYSIFLNRNPLSVRFVQVVR